MSSAAADIMLFHWNIIEIGDDLAIFVGMKHKLGCEDETFPFNCSFRTSTAIRSFDAKTGVGITTSGRVYYCTGKPSDPHGLIRLMVKLKYEGLRYRYRFEFTAAEA